MHDMVQLAQNIELVNNYRKLARDYGMFARKVNVPQPGAEDKEYLIFSLSRVPNDVDPVAIINRNERNPKLFHPENFAVELHSENPLLLWEKISRYIGHAEYMYEIYDQYNTPLPKAIRTDELDALVAFYNGAQNPSFSEQTREEYRDGLREFFKDENPKTKFKKEWQEFFRSELYDPKKSSIQNYFTFLKRHEPETTLHVLVESSDDLKKVYMPEHRYQELREIIKERYPDVKFTVSEKRVVDKGIMVDPKTGERVKTPVGVTVTDEEYDRIMEERFHLEGNACVDGLNTTVFVGRDVVYKASDENIIASVFHEIALRWAKCNSIAELKSRGALSSVEIPVGHLMNFYAGMRASSVPFHVDYHVNSSPNFETVRVVYNACDEQFVHSLLVGLAMAQVTLAHLSYDDKDVKFDIEPRKIDSLIQQARSRVIEPLDTKQISLGGEQNLRTIE